MAQYYYFNDTGEKIGPVSGSEIKALVAQGGITPETVIKLPDGTSFPARKVKGLTFAKAITPPQIHAEQYPVTVPPAASNQFVRPVPVGNKPVPPIQITPSTPNPSRRFCTNCGNTVSGQAVACMSCGAKPTGHKKFCNSCGIHVNSFQVVCVKCGTSLGETRHEVASGGDNESSNFGAVLMHLIWPWSPLVTFIIWACIANKNPKTSIHGKHILNAFLSVVVSFFLYSILFVVGVGFATIAKNGMAYDWLMFVAIFLLIPAIILGFNAVIFRPIMSSIIVAVAAGKGEVLPYKWATRFFKT